MKSIISLALTGMLLSSASAAAQAGEVTVGNLHVCCPACVKALDTALADVPGVSNANTNRQGKSVTFTAADDKAAEAGVKALADAGFYGTAKHGDKDVAFPASGAADDATADTVVLSNVHLCCGGCVNAATKAVKAVPNVTGAKGDSKAKTITITGNAVEVAKAVEALNKAGFFGTAGK